MSIPKEILKILQNKHLFLEAKKCSLQVSHLELTFFSFLQVLVRSLEV